MNAPGTDHSEPGKRVLIAVAFADVVNYSAMMAFDEAQTYTEWMAVLGTIVRPQAEQHGGVVVKSTGDGVLARFGSALDAVRWAAKVQQAVRKRHGDGASPEGGVSRVELRISIHIGDVIMTDDDIFGDGVNVAARLLEHAAPGGVIMSEAVHDLVRGSGDAPAVDLGFRNLKSFERPVRTYQLQPSRVEARPRPGPDGSMPSLAVLPLTNLSGDPADDYFADGVVEDVIVSLAGLGELMVISRASTLMFRGRVADPREVGRALGVRYVLMGTLRRSPRAIRIGWQLCDANDGMVIWSEAAEAPSGELFDMQERIVIKVASGIVPKVRVAELRRAMRKRPESFTAYDHTLRAMHSLLALGSDEFARARTSLDAAMAEDPFFAMPFAWAAWWHMMTVGQGHTADTSQHLEQAAALAGRAVELDSNNALALSIYGHIKSFLYHQYDAGLLYLERALIVGPSSPLAWTFSAASLAYTGQGARAVQQAERSLRLSPFDRAIFFMHSNLCLANYANETFAEAVTWGRRSEAENPLFTANYRLLAGSLVASGELGEARQVAARMLALEPGFKVSEWARTRQPFRDPAAGRLYAERLLAAGFPK